MAEFSPRPEIPGQIQSKPLEKGKNSQNAPSELRTIGENTEVNPESPRERNPAELKGLPEGAEVTLEPPQVEPTVAWQMYVDRARNCQGAGTGVVLKSPEGAVFEQCLRFNFLATNNEAEYEALIAGLRSASKLGVPELCVYSDSKLVINQKDAQVYVRMCNKCQLFSPLIHQPARDLSPFTSSWPFAQWGMDIVGFLPRAPGNKRFLLVAIDYFTKWVEAEPLATD
ncbi:hypothetical protein Acr_05g0012030 [Actinidia rufa]|uniref:Integrase catalytic domain-containing protein n=1 Tax=Actinidia rufa TaxID=165716 RepID=A0A7J0EM64_9ERIC|nr:hypothetical protein Acr_05g0012030 [Actinidia rufa]